MANSIKAELIGETSAGATIVQIYEDGELVWSHDYFATGASGSEYTETLKNQVYDDMTNAADWRQYDGCDRDDDGDVIDHRGKTHKVAWAWTPESGFEFVSRVGQSDEFAALNDERLPDEQMDAFDFARYFAR